MKNKKVTYVLMGLVVVIWGGILYRIFQAFFEGDEPQQTAASAQPTRTNVMNKERDTFQLLLNYEDPFMGPAARQVRRRSTPQPQPKEQKPAKNAKQKQSEQDTVSHIDWSIVKYMGVIKNPKEGRKVGLVKIKGREHMIKEKDTANQLAFRRILEDSLEVDYKGEQKWIAKEKMY